MKGQTQVVNHHLHSAGLDGGNLETHTGVKTSGLDKEDTCILKLSNKIPNVELHQFVTWAMSRADVTSYLDGSLGFLEFNICDSFNAGVDKEIA